MTFPPSWIVGITPVLVVWLLFSFWVGYKRGFLLQLYNLLAMFAALLFAWVLSEPFAKVFTIVNPDLGSQQAIEELISIKINTAIWFVILYIAISLLIMLGRPMVKAFGKIPVLSTVNSFFGAIFSVIGWYITVLILILLLSTPLVTNGQDVVEDSGLSWVKSSSSVILDVASERIRENTAIQRLISGESLSLADSDSIRDWLLSQGVSENDIITFLEGLN